MTNSMQIVGLNTLNPPLDYDPPTSGQCFCNKSNMSSVTSPCTTTSSSPVTDDPHEKCWANTLLAFFRSISREQQNITVNYVIYILSILIPHQSHPHTPYTR